MKVDKKPKLKVSGNNRYLMFEDGKPFFYMGDTAWELFHRLTLREAEYYLQNRREKKFNVIQAVILAEEDGLTFPNANGDLPLIGNDPLEPNELYFDHIDKIISLAGEKGIFVGLLPTWGDKLEILHGKGPVIFNPQNAYLYGQWLGKRYKDVSNIIWINGGDRQGGGDNFPIWDALGKGIKNEDKNHLMTFHPPGGNGGHSSSEWFHDAVWLDFNIIQSGHESRELKNYLNIEKDYSLIPSKPVMDAEPRYEDHAINWKPENGWFNDHDVRQAAYWSVFSGACGHTYGCQPVWQMYDHTRAAVSFVRRTWREALDLPGAKQMEYLFNFMTEMDFTRFVPAQYLLFDQTGEDIRCLQSENTLLIYSPNPSQVNLFIPKDQHFTTSWLNPENGITIHGEEFIQTKRLQLSTPQGFFDSVLIIKMLNTIN